MADITINARRNQAVIVFQGRHDVDIPRAHGNYRPYADHDSDSNNGQMCCIKLPDIAAYKQPDNTTQLDDYINHG